ncbi:type II toxin-antitoxin system RelE/ParE family toxin [Brenneria tiliae]|uniref:type II toxin-antitoxin system RelE/ParE family toxin n=1 Tax=Brenneria tiliae TaxID=2914984 RepID=UPI0034DB7813
MANVRIQEASSCRLDEIYRYTCERWGTEQADRYITFIFQAIDRIKTHEVVSRPIPAEFGVEGFFFHYEQHVVY